MFKESHMQASIADDVLVILFSGFLCLWYSSALKNLRFVLGVVVHL